LSDVAVVIEGVSLWYFTPEQQTLALSHIDLQIRRGEFVAIVGQSGCGKSTLLSLISGLIAPSQGRVIVGNAVVRAPSPQVGYMLQQDTLFEWRSILDNTLLGAEIMGVADEKHRARALDLLRRYGLGDFVGSYPNELSGGMRQRAALARTLCTQPDILLLDEPFSALDFQTRLTLSDEISEILRNEGKTAILVTHDISEAISMADRVIVMSRRPGRIKAEYAIAFPSFGENRPSPFLARKCAEFNTLFETIWNELQEDDGHVR
jgi:NitT/TauT family transport system ATP-binding protein